MTCSMFSKFKTKKMFGLIGFLIVFESLLCNRTWLEKNVDDAKGKLHECWPIRDEIIRLRESLCKALGLNDIVWDCGWGTRHFRGCLESFQALAAQHPETMGVLRGKPFKVRKVRVLREQVLHLVLVCWFSKPWWGIRSSFIYGLLIGVF